MLRFAIALVWAALAASPAAAEYAVGAAAYSDGDFDFAYQEFLDGAEQGDPRAQYGIAVMYHKGKGVTQDFAKAAEWYEQAALQGHVMAQNNLGIMYRRGEGVARDPREAFSWIWMAAMQGEPRAEMNLSEMFRRGEGVGQDLVQAYAWLDFAISDLPKDARHLAETRRDQIVAALDGGEIRRAERMAQALRESRG